MRAGIAGGGIMGQLLAFSLINAGWNVTLFDQSNGENCSMAAAGLLTPVAELEKNDLMIFELGNDALNHHWPVILEHLKSDIYFKRLGSLILSHPRDYSDLKHFIRHISNKITNDSYIQKLNSTEITKLEPDASKFNIGYFFSIEGQIDNQMLLSALQVYLTEREITWLKNTVVLNVKPGEISVRNKTYQFDFVFDCRGLGSKDQFKDLRSVRGELIWLEAPDVFITRPIRFLHPRYSLYIVPRPNQTYLIGASEIESDDLSPVSVRTTMELLTAAYCVNSKFSEARIIKTVTQCRPTLSNHLPKIKYTDGLIAVNGLYRHGFLIAPTLAHEVMRWILEKNMTRYSQLWEKYS